MAGKGLSIGLRQMQEGLAVLQLFWWAESTLVRPYEPRKPANPLVADRRVQTKSHTCPFCHKSHSNRFSTLWILYICGKSKCVQRSTINHNTYIQAVIKMYIVFNTNFVLVVNHLSQLLTLHENSSRIPA